MLKATTGPRIPQEPVLRELTSFDAYQYLHHLRRRLRFILAVCLGAGALALGISLLLPKQYTATASIVIDPPAGGDPRAATAVNPAYLESLRSYELFASGDTLFQRALDKFHLRDARSPIESMKRRVLKVTKVRDTNVLQIAVTLPEPRQAQELAQFLAQETVDLNRDANRNYDRDLTGEADLRSKDARARLETEQRAWREFTTREPLDPLRTELGNLNGLRTTLRRDLADSRVEMAEYKVRGEDIRAEAVAARIDSLEKQDVDLGKQIDTRVPLLAAREARAAELDRNLRVAQAADDAARARVRELRAAEGLRGERLRVMDPGVVPERPSSPNVGLNVALALAAALAACVVFLTLTFRPLIHDRSSQV